MTSNWFSNFLPFDTPMDYQGMRFKNVETFYQAMKTLDVEIRKKISLSTAAESKKIGRSIIIRNDWEDIKQKVMLFALNYKFTLDTTWGKKLVETQEDIIEWNYWHDNYWGECTCSNCKYTNVIPKNVLGKMLVDIRTKLKEQQK
jgi:ribA/ribD-fused uncharacterized protein